MIVITWLAPFAASAAVALAAYRARALDPGGAFAACLVGGLITVAGGWRPGFILIAFFISASLLSRVADRLRPGHDALAARGSRRDAWQVIANGGIATLCALLYALNRDSIALVAFSASLATAAADTWATELGAFNRQRPRLITTFQPVAPGTSGAISPIGTAATIAGSSLIAIMATALMRASVEDSSRFLIAVTIGGISGSLIDSLLGATLQRQFQCPICNESTDSRVHRCGATTTHTRGLAFLSNDAVNISAIIAGAIFASLLWTI